MRRLAIIVILIMKQRSKQVGAPGGGGLYDGHHNVRRVVRFNTEAYQAALSIPEIQGVNLTGPFRSTKEYLLAQLTKVICFYETLDMKHWEALFPPLMLERWEEDDYNAATDGKISKARKMQAKTRLLAYLKCLKGFVEASRFDTPFLQPSLPGKLEIDGDFFLHHPGLVDGSCLLMDGTDLVSITGWENTKYVICNGTRGTSGKDTGENDRKTE